MVPGLCASACANVFFGGVERRLFVAGPAGALHRAALIPSSGVAALPQHIHRSGGQLHRATLVYPGEMGIDHGLLALKDEIAHDDIVFPDEATLTRPNVLTGRR